MRISLVHGEDNAKAYNRYRELIDQSKKKGFEIVQITDIHNIVSQSLFEDKIVFTLEKANKIKLNGWKWLGKNAPKYNSNLLIYWEGEAGAVVIRNFPKDSKIERFDLPKIIFNFLDSFYPGNSKQVLKLLNELVVQQPIELVFHLLVRHVRDLYWISVSKETIGMPSWRAEKIARQAGKFEPIKIKKIINELALIDIKSKTTQTSLKNSLDMIIIKSLQ
ncbi:hypothetical protein BH10PAT1_BH10PAT1_3200 [soil metagenome]